MQSKKRGLLAPNILYIILLILQYNFFHMSWYTFIVQDLNKFLSLCGQYDPFSVDYKIYSLEDICEEVHTSETTYPEFFNLYISHLLGIIRYYINVTDPRDIILLYETIKCNIYEFPQIYNQEDHDPFIIQYVNMICFEISKIFRDPSVTTLNINTDIESDKLAYHDDNTLTVNNYVLIIKKVIEIIDFRDLMPELIRQFYPFGKCGQQSVQTAFFILICQFCRIQGIQQQKATRNILYKGLLNQRPKVRYYAIHALMCFTKYVDSKKFHQLYIEFLPLLIMGLNDHDEYLACKWLSCFNLYVRKLGQQKDTLVNNLDYLNTQIYYFIHYSVRSQIKLCSLDCLVLLAEISQFVSFKEVQKYLQICYEVFIYFQNNQQVLNKAIESLCEIIAGINHQLEIQKYIDPALHIILYFKQQIQVETVVNCWRSLCLTGIKFENWTKLFVDVFEIAKEFCGSEFFQLRSIAYSIFKYTSICFEIKSEDYFIPVIQMIVTRLRIAVNRNQKDQVQQICSAFNSIISTQRPKSSYFKYFHQESDNMMKQQNELGYLTQSNEKIKAILKTFKHFYNLLKIADRIKNNVNVPLLLSFRVLIEYYGDILPKMQYVPLLRIFWCMVNVFHTKKTYKQNMNKNNQKHSLNLVKVTFPLLLESIIKKIHPEMANRVLTDTLCYIQKVVNSSRNPSDLICITRYIAALQFLPSQKIQQHYAKFISFFMQNSAHPSPNLRAEIAYTVGLIASKTPLKDFQRKLNGWLNIINRCINTPKNSYNIQELGVCLDNCTSAFGHIIHRFGKYKDLYNLQEIWLNQLPLKYNKEHYIQQIDFLTNLVIFQTKTIIQQKINQNEQLRLSAKTKIQTLLRIFSEVKFYLEKQPKFRENIETLQRIQLAVSYIKQRQICRTNFSMDLSKEQFKQ